MVREKDKLTVDEIIGTIRHSKLPTLLVEGKDDMSAFRSLERDLGCDVLSCGGRHALFLVHERRNSFAGKDCVFLADKDMYVFDCVPQEYEDIIFTEGYSIENDILCGTKLKNALSHQDLMKFDVMKKGLCRWWAIEVSLHRVSPAKCDIDKSIYKIFQNIHDSSPEINIECYEDGLLSTLETVDAIEEEIFVDFELKMRGHQLHQIYKFFFANDSAAEAKRLAGCLLLACINLEKPPYYQELVSRIKHAFQFAHASCVEAVSSDSLMVD